MSIAVAALVAALSDGKWVPNRKSGFRDIICEKLTEFFPPFNSQFFYIRYWFLKSGSSGTLKKTDLNVHILHGIRFQYLYIETDQMCQTIDKTLPEYWVPLPNSSLEAPKQVQLCQSVEWQTRKLLTSLNGDGFILGQKMYYYLLRRHFLFRHFSWPDFFRENTIYKNTNTHSKPENFKKAS